MSRIKNLIDTYKTLWGRVISENICSGCGIKNLKHINCSSITRSVATDVMIAGERSGCVLSGRLGFRVKPEPFVLCIIRDMKYIIGIDEVGRGPLAGPVTVCAVRVEVGMYKKLQKNKTLPPIGKDSKKLSKKDREKYSQVLCDLALEGKFDFTIVMQSNVVIDTKGLSFAIKKALVGCLQKINAKKEDSVLLDGGLRAPLEFKNQKTIIKGDEKHPIIAWASILAKIHRDNYMIKMAKKYPEYGFEKHMGYGTRVHREAIEKYGSSCIHRASFLRNI